jgi:hypothetical protein
MALEKSDTFGKAESTQPSDVGVSPETIKVRQGAYEMGAAMFAGADPRTTAWLREHIQKIDFQKMQSVYTRIAEQKDPLERTLECVPAERTYVVGSGNLIAQPAVHEYGYNINALNGDYYRDRLATMEQKQVFATLVHDLFHENAHATSAVKIYKTETGNICFDVVYEGTALSGKTSATPSLFINEGITDTVAGLAARLYLKESPIQLADDSSFTLEEYDAFMSTAGTERMFVMKAARDFVDRLATLISQETGMPAGDVMARLASGYFRGGEFLAEYGTLLDQTFGPDFVTDIRAVETSEGIASLATKYPLPPLTSSVREYFLKEVEKDAVPK